MKRLVCMLVLLLFGLPLAAPLLALAEDMPLNGSMETAAHACCRRAGAHHCTGNTEDQGTGARLRAPMPACPYAPASVVATDLHLLAPATSEAIFAELVSHPAVHAQTESRGRIALDRARQKRGPPAPLSL